jgi:hypothetical protein
MFKEMRRAQFHLARRRNASLLLNTAAPDAAVDTDNLRQVLATANYLATFANKTYPDTRMIHILANSLMDMVKTHRGKLDHTVTFDGARRTLEEHYDRAIAGLGTTDRHTFQEMLGHDTMRKLQYLQDADLSCQDFQLGIGAMLDSLADTPVETKPQKRYVKLFLDVLGQVAAAKYSGCLPAIREQFYLLENKLAYHT